MTPLRAAAHGLIDTLVDAARESIARHLDSVADRALDLGVLALPALLPALIVSMAARVAARRVRP